MFALHKMWMFNFRTYRGAHEFEFPAASGLYYFSGVNKLDALGSNGSGKSTFLDAITWCLYGHTSRGLKANDIITWGLSTASVKLELTVGDKRFMVKRTQKPNTLLLIEDGVEKPVDQEELEKHLRLNFKAFMSAVLNAQFGVSFFQLKPSEKLELFSKIMDLDFWLEKSEAAANESKSLVKDIAGWEQAIVQQATKIEAAQADIKELKARAANFDEETAQKAAAANLAQRDAALELKVQVKKLKQLKEKLKTLEFEAAPHKVALNEANEYVETVLSRIQLVSKKRHELVGERRALKREVDAIYELPENCPTCEQPISDKHREIHAQAKETELRQLDGSLAMTDTTLQALAKDIVKGKNRIGVCEDKVNEFRADIKSVEGSIVRKNALIDELNRDCDRLTAQYEEHLNRENPFIEMGAAKTKQLKVYQKILAEAEETKARLEAENEAVSYWPSGFKRLRLLIIEQAFNSLEIEVNNSLAQLGMLGWSISFDIERENKSGGVTKGFIVLIKSPRHAEPVKWESWSGGETQRLQLAGDMGLANLIMEQAGLVNSIEFYDEPSTHLSPEGMLDLANMLHERALAENKQIWIVDHAAITNFGDFQGIITARKGKNGSSIGVALDP